MAPIGHRAEAGRDGVPSPSASRQGHNPGTVGRDDPIAPHGRDCVPSPSAANGRACRPATAANPGSCGNASDARSTLRNLAYLALRENDQIFIQKPDM